MPDEAGVSVSPDHNQTYPMLLGGLNYSLPGRRSLHGESARAKSRISRERGSILGSFLRGQANLVRGIGVKVALGHWFKAHIGGLPYAHHKRVAIRRELAPCALNR
jgi:hypothetical protein